MFPPHTPQWGLNIGAPAALLVGVSGDGPPYSTPESAKRKEVCPSEVGALGLPIIQQYASHELVNVRLLDNTIYPRTWTSKSRRYIAVESVVVVLAGLSNLALRWNRKESAMLFRELMSWRLMSKPFHSSATTIRQAPQLINSLNNIALSLRFHLRAGLDKPANTTTADSTARYRLDFDEQDEGRMGLTLKVEGLWMAEPNMLAQRLLAWI